MNPFSAFSSSVAIESLETQLTDRTVEAVLLASSKLNGQPSSFITAPHLSTTRSNSREGSLRATTKSVPQSSPGMDDDVIFNLGNFSYSLMTGLLSHLNHATNKCEYII